MHAVIFAGGTLRPGKAANRAIATADLIIAADKGALTALQYGCTPAIIVGDFDSLIIPSDELKRIGSKLMQVAVEKDETDTELAVQTAVERGANTITLLGGLGGERFDHTMANILLLAGFENISSIRIVDGPSVCWLLRGPGSTRIQGQPADLLSLLPLTADATEVRTQGLYYPLKGETLRFGKPRGVSNVFTGEQAEVSLADGMLLIIYTDMEELSSP
jgi:thiamine pyrophosphokinase